MISHYIADICAANTDQPVAVLYASTEAAGTLIAADAGMPLKKVPDELTVGGVVACTIMVVTAPPCVKKLAAMLVTPVPISSVFKARLDASTPVGKLATLLPILNPVINVLP